VGPSLACNGYEVIDRFARNAWRHGRSPGRYRRIAHHRADATWVFVILALVLWIFVSWPWVALALGLAAATFVQSLGARVVASRLEALYDASGKKPFE
jgi:divalent metal cation (Fe/Co/Zn/Cd) transporter